MTPKTLVIDDDAEVREALAETLELAGFAVATAQSWAAAKPIVAAGGAEIVVTDVRMPREDGFSVLRGVQAIDKEIPVIMVTGHADVQMGVRAMRQGAYDFIEKPIEPDYVIGLVARARQHRGLVLDHRRLLSLIQSNALEGRILGQTPAIAKLRDLIAALAQVDVTVLVHGETGVGKELVARALHDFGPRAQGPFVAINCAALPPALLESDLFGHEPGAFTGARERRIGKIEQAHRGTLFLDEIEGMSMEAQARLLRVLQERRVERLGGQREIAVDVRVVAAAKADLAAQAGKGQFREDLVYRLNVVQLDVPPLRARGHADVEMLFRHFFDAAARRLGERAAPMPALADMLSHDWPGNVRELRNAAERAALGFPALAAKPDQIKLDPVAAGAARSELLNPSAHAGATEPGRAGGAARESGGTLAERMSRHEKREIAQALAAGGQLQHVAATLGVSRKTLYLKMREHGLGGGDAPDESVG
jgi:two-component system C4-dicarboxylate transport response regulator DctD